MIYSAGGATSLCTPVLLGIKRMMAPPATSWSLGASIPRAHWFWGHFRVTNWSAWKNQFYPVFRTPTSKNRVKLLALYRKFNNWTPSQCCWQEKQISETPSDICYILPFMGLFHLVTGLSCFHGNYIISGLSASPGFLRHFDIGPQGNKVSADKAFKGWVSSSKETYRKPNIIAKRMGR